MNVMPETPVGALVAERLGRARVFDRLGIDYCCHGATPLAEACAVRALDVGRVLGELAESDHSDPNGDAADRADFTSMAPGDLADHIVETHHAYLRRELPRLADLLDKVVSAHGGRHSELHAVRETFADLREELESHMLKEERELFPLVKRLEWALGRFPISWGSVGDPLRVMRHEHGDARAALERLRWLTGGYHTPADGCASFRALYDGLADLESDLHRHIHKENNILFPKAAALEAALARAGV
jgi:regulator of cell morphogenesis and NO signaling